MTDYTKIPEHLLPSKLGTDASKWAAAFCQRFPDKSPDEGTMIGWFANAIEQARDTFSEGDGPPLIVKMKPVPPPDLSQDELDRLSRRLKAGALLQANEGANE